jgi:branched-chain amino acid transport system ATP-binding protein
MRFATVKWSSLVIVSKTHGRTLSTVSANYIFVHFKRSGQTGADRLLYAMIEVKNLRMQFGGIRAVDDVSLTLETGRITGLIGPNGAGKTTLFNVIAGHYKPTSGQVLLDGQDITGLPPHELFAKGLLRTFQIAHEFSTLTVRENLMMVPPRQTGESLLGTWLQSRKVREEEEAVRAKADDVIHFLEIGHVADELAGNLSGGQKKLLELGRTMMTEAKIVFLDEVGAGVNRTLLNTLGDAIIRLNKERGYTFCMIEHDMDFIGRLCDPVIVMAEGRVLATGSAVEVTANEQVIEAYLGRGLKNKTGVAV